MLRMKRPRSSMPTVLSCFFKALAQAVVFDVCVYECKYV